MRFILVLLSLLATPLWADEVRDTLRAEARAMIYAGDIDGFRAAIIAAHADDLAAKGDQNRQRALFDPFGVTDPRVAAFTADWLAAEPDSPYALTGRAWHLRAMGIAMRGNDLPRFVYPAAMDAMAALHGEAMQLAFRARDLAPDMIAASDAVIRLAQSFGMAELAEEELARIMAIAPNHGSLLRASNTLSPKWGGSVDAIARACEDYATLLPDVADYNVDICLVEMFDENRLQGAPQTWSWNKLLELPDHPNLIYARKSMMWAGWLINPEMELAVFEAYVARGGDPVDVASRIDSLRQKLSWSAVETYPDVIAAELAKAKAQLEHDAGNPALVERYFEMMGRAPEGAAQPALSEQIAIVERMLEIAPYNVEGWVNLAHLRWGPTPEDFRAVASAATNAIVYSNYKARNIAVVIALYAHRYRDPLDDAATGDPDAATWYDVDAEVTCPYVRLIRLLHHSCDVEGIAADECARYPSSAEMQTDIDVITEQGICRWERTADIDALAVTPVTAP